VIDVATRVAQSTLLARVRDAALDRSYVSMGSRRTTSVHEFYRYPARFSPDFARAAIAAFSETGELVLDPFVGGGTTLVEARLLGRLAVGSDINELAVFVSQAKTQLHSHESLAVVRAWVKTIDSSLRLDRSAASHAEWDEAGYQRHIGGPDTWRLRHVLAQAIDSLPSAPASAHLLARCAVLRTGQWALDMRDDLPSVSDFRAKLKEAVEGMIRVAGDYTRGVRAADRHASASGLRRTRILKAAVPGLSDDERVRRYPTPRLILTSPPYPGVYVNYHRWKLRGRLETAAPYWVADRLDGHGIAHYTMGAKSDKRQDIYFSRLQDAWKDLVQLGDDETWVVQMVGFNDADQQLPRYLDVMEAAGLREVLLPDLATDSDGRLWRDVPGRRWWVKAGDRQATAQHTSREVVLVHRIDA
jgi:hypothetical protein